MQNIILICAIYDQIIYGYQLKNYRGLKLMKRITPIILSAFSALALSFSVSTFADNTDSDGFIIFGAQTTDASPAASNETAEQTQTTSTTVSQQTQEGNTNSDAQVQEAAPTKEPKVKKKKNAKKAKNKPRKRAKRAVRKKRSTRTTRAKRSNSLKRASSYRVRKGDTLYRISVKSGVSLNRLIRLNKLHGSKKHRIQAGQKIRLR